jgi:hypothetical protein
MCALKVCLWIHGLGCLLSVFSVLLPMRLLESLYATLLRQPFPDAPEMVYAVRVTSAMSVMLGGFFILLALHPVECGVLVPFAGWASVFLGVVCVIGGLEAEMPFWWFLGDALWCLVLGVLIVLFWREARPTPANAMETAQ